MKILIIGFGKMGKSHFQSFSSSKKSYEIYLFDKKFNSKKNYTENNNKIIKLKSFPRRKKFDLVIISTCSDVRLKIMEKVIKYNKFKFLLLEKFLFSNLNDYKIAEKLIFKNQLKVFVNVWGKIILNKFKNIIKKKDIKKIHIYCKKGELITNLIHYYDFIFCLLKRKFSLKFQNNYKIIKSRRKKFLEINGNLSSINQKDIRIFTLKNINYHKFEIVTNDKIYIIKINYDGNCKYYINGKLVLKNVFPFSFLTTEKFFLNDFKSKKINYYKNFKNISHLSTDIILMLQNLIKERFSIT